MSQREAFQQKLEARMEAWKADLDKLEAEAKELNAEAGQRLQNAIGEVKSRKNAAADRLREAKSAREEQWEEAKLRAGHAVDHVQEGFREAYRELRGH